MNQRLNFLNQHFVDQTTAVKGKPTSKIWESMGLDRLLRPEVAQKRIAAGEMMSKQDFRQDTNDATMPFWMVPKIQQLGIDGFQIKNYGGVGFTNLESGAIYYELAKHDASVATFVLVHNGIGNNVVDALGDEEQK
jgi:alkylation response protein AidB-like acyl-CoA dehydrogenase